MACGLQIRDTAGCNPALQGEEFCPAPPQVVCSEIGFICLRECPINIQCCLPKQPVLLEISISEMSTETSDRGFGKAAARGRQRNWFPTAALVLCLAVIAGGASLYYWSQCGQVKGRVEAQLIAIADSKVSQIVNWRSERRDDARFLSKASFVARDVQAFLAHPDSPRNRAEVLGWLERLADTSRYEQAVLFDTNLTPRLLARTEQDLDLDSVDHVAAVFRTNGIVMTDLHCGSVSHRIHLDLLFPVFAPGTEGASTNSPIAVIALEINPHQFLYPLLKSWPTPSASGESAIARREGDTVRFLSDLRFRTNSAFNLSFSLDRPDLPAAIALRGREGVVEGQDYRGVPVLTVFRRIPESPWFLGAKVDKVEALAALKTQSVVIGVAALALALAVFGGTGWRWHGQQARYLRSQLVAEAAARKHEERYRSLFENMLNGFAYCRMVYENGEPRDFVYQAVNRSFERLTGLKDVVGKKISELIPGIHESDPDLLAAYGRVARTGVSEKFERYVAAWDKWFSTAVYSPRQDHFVAVFDDITERKRAEKAVERERILLRTVIDHLPDPIYVKDMHGAKTLANRAEVAWMGLPSEAEALGKRISMSIRPKSLPNPRRRMTWFCRAASRS